MNRKSGEIAHRAFRAFPFVLTLACGGLLIYCAIRGEPGNVSREDGLLEWGTVYFMLVCAALAVGALVVSRRRLRRPQRLFLLLLSLMLLLGAGEELSWGQRLFGWQAPEMLSSKGSLIRAGHGDIAIHNLSFRSTYLRFSVGGVLFGVVLLTGMFLHGVWLPLALRREKPSARWIVDRLGVFVPPLELGILAVTAAAVFHFLKPLELTESREYKEFIIILILAFMLVHSCFRHSRQEHVRASWALLGAIILWAIGSFVLLSRTV